MPHSGKDLKSGDGRRTAIFTSTIALRCPMFLRGDKPADLTKFETALNLRTAKVLGLTVPPSLLVAADDVIE